VNGLRRVCVFSGSSPGARPAYRAMARSLGTSLARAGLGLVYGGAKVGLMGALADAAIESGGEAIGVIPKALVDKELAHPGLTELRVVASMHERKQQMAELADAFVALPGGMGTLEEMAEILTWAQLGIHAKPCGLLNVEGYYDRLTHFLDHAVAERFITPEHRSMLVVAATPGELLQAFATYRAPTVKKWVDLDQT
jgi:uncharacterized protein (TIGR00730 family)